MRRPQPTRRERTYASAVAYDSQAHKTGRCGRDLGVNNTLDTLPRSRTRDYVRGLLVEHGALPHRDELLGDLH